MFRRNRDIHSWTAVPRMAAIAFAGTALAILASGQAGAQMNKNWVTVVVAAETDTVDACMAPRATAGTIVMRNVVETLTERDPATGEGRLAQFGGRTGAGSRGCGLDGHFSPAASLLTYGGVDRSSQLSTLYRPDSWWNQ